MILKKIKTRFILIGLPIILFITLIFEVYLSLQQPLYAQDITCVAPALADYVASVFDNLGTTRSYGNIRFLSPAFNMSHPYFQPFVAQFSDALAEHGYNFGDFYAVAGNAYNMPGGTIHGWIGTARMTAIGNHPIILTETGFYPPNNPPGGRNNALIDLQGSISGLKSDPSILGALLFNVFGTNGDPNFAGHKMNDDEINMVCGGSCGKIGANSAVFYSSSDASFYDRAAAHGMGFTLEVACNDIQRITPGINSAHNKGMTPVLRIGVGGNSGGFDDPAELASFIRDLNPLVNGPVYIILGPNEPLTESWAAPNCAYTNPSNIFLSPGYPYLFRKSPIWPPDPGHFYIPKRGNEDIVQIVRSLVFEAESYAPGYIPGLPGPPGPPPQSTCEPPENPPIAGVILNIEDLRQTDSRWSSTTINDCQDRIGEYTSACPSGNGCGCGIVSMTMVLRYFGHDVYPNNIAPRLRNGQEYVCGIGSSLAGLSQWAKDNYDLEFVWINFDQLQGQIRLGRPVIAACAHWGRGCGFDRDHLSVIKGMEEGYVYYQDTVNGHIAFPESIARTFNCAYVAYYQP